jgi:hypothetical protein
MTVPGNRTPLSKLKELASVQDGDIGKYTVKSWIRTAKNLYDKV